MISGFRTRPWLPKPTILSFETPGYLQKSEGKSFGHSGFLINLRILEIGHFESCRTDGRRQIPPIRLMQS